MATQAEVKAIRAPGEAGAIGNPSVLRCGLLIFAVKTALKIRGLGWTVRWVRRRVESIPAVVPVSAKALRSTERVVAMAGAFYPGRALCLEQSLVLYYILRRQGIAAKYCQGVQAHPFLAHAWVEYLDEPINDLEEHVKRFTRFSEEPL